MGLSGWLSIGAGGIGAAGLLVALWALWSREKEKRRADNLAASLKACNRTLEQVSGELALTRAEVKRHDETIRFLKGEIDGLERDMDSCSDPGDVRERARLLLARAKAGV